MSSGIAVRVGIFLFVGYLFGIAWAFVASFVLGLSGHGIGVGEAFIVALVLVWIRMGWRVVGSGPVRYVALLTRFGRPLRLIEVGPVLTIWPFEGLWRIPTGGFNWNYVVQAHTKDRVWVELTLHIDFHWPTPGNEEQRFHFKPDGLEKGLTLENAGQVNTNDWEEQSAFSLLQRAYYRFPWEPMRADWEDLQRFFRGTAVGAIVSILGEMDRDEFIGHQERAEVAAKVMMLSEWGDPFLECGIPPEVLNIKVTRVDPILPGTKEVLEAELRARREGEAQVVRSQYAKSATSDDAERIASIVRAYTDQGVDSTTAGILAEANVTGEEVPLEKMMMLSIAMAGLGGSTSIAHQVGATQRRQRGQRKPSP